jgi:hypothetical protein
MLLARPVTPVARIEEDTSMSAPPEMAPVQPAGAPGETEGAGRPGAGPAGPVIAPAEGAPRTGVEIAGVDTRDGIRFFTLRDLRNGSLVRNVTFKSARDLWHYALKQHATGAYAPEKIPWTGDRAILASSERAGKMRYDLALREADGQAHVFYGVIEDGMDEAWRALVGADRPAPAAEPASEGFDEPESVPGPDPE